MSYMIARLSHSTRARIREKEVLIQETVSSLISFNCCYSKIFLVEDALLSLFYSDERLAPHVNTDLLGNRNHATAVIVLVLRLSNDNFGHSCLSDTDFPTRVEKLGALITNFVGKEKPKRPSKNKTPWRDAAKNPAEHSRP